MRRWKCIKSYNSKKWTVGKIYETDENGKGLMADDGDGNYWNEPWKFVGNYFEEIKDFTLADLKPCMVVVTRDGRAKMVINTKNGTCVVDKNGYYSDISLIDKNFEYKKSNRDLDIMKVYDICNIMCDSQEIKTDNRELLWERVEKSPTQIKLEALEQKQREMSAEQTKIADELEQLRKEIN